LGLLDVEEMFAGLFCIPKADLCRRG
jgi:hypothetical protein